MQPNSGRIATWVVVALILASLVLVFLLPADVLLTARGTDMVSEFAASRAFLAASVARGHLPLWNPYTYGGQPFLGGFESAALYPPSLLFVVLPLARALNFSMLLHLIVLGWGVERWAASRGIGAWASALAGLVIALSGPVFPHLYAGHLSNLCTMAWAPWIFLGLESWVQRGRRGGLFLASAGICLQILAGHVQYFFYTAVAAALQALVLTLAQPAARRRAIPALAGCYAAGLTLGAAQLLPGLAASAEGIRQQNLDYGFAAMFGFPPENFLTLLAPGFFGTLSDTALSARFGDPIYWGRCYLWEMSLFLGAVAPLLIALAVIPQNRLRRQVLADLVIVAALLVLALGVHTPLFGLLYHDAPGFGHFRSWSKFIFPAALFLALALAAGTDHLLRGRAVPAAVGWGGLVLGGQTLLAAGILCVAPELLSGFFQLVAASQESYLPGSFFNQPDALRTAAWHASLSLALGGAVLAGAGVVLLFVERKPVLRWVLPVMLGVEMLGFAAGLIPVAHLADATPDGFRQFLAAHPGDYRVLNLAQPDNGFLLGAGDVGGNNPTVLRRYAELMNFIGGGDPGHVTQYLPFNGFDPLDALVRLRYVLEPNGAVLESNTPPLPHVLLLSDWKIAAGRDAIFSALRAPSFHPDRTALLEATPNPLPEPGALGTARVLADEPDQLTLEADTDKPALLLVTDLEASGWRAEALPGSVQSHYQILPADYVLRAVPLMAGHHRLRMVYSSPSFSLGLGISSVAWLAWLGLLVRSTRKQTEFETTRDPRAAEPEAPFR